MLAHEESGDLAAKLIRETCARQGIEPNTLRVHADRGPVPKGKTVKQTLLDLDVGLSFSRPRVSNDNPFSEAEFRTLKYGPDYPDRFDGYEHARGFCQRFFPWYTTNTAILASRTSPPPMSTTGASPPCSPSVRPSWTRRSLGCPSAFPQEHPVSPDRPPPSGSTHPRTAPRSSSDYTKPTTLVSHFR